MLFDSKNKKIIPVKNGKRKFKTMADRYLVSKKFHFICHSGLELLQNCTE